MKGNSTFTEFNKRLVRQPWLLKICSLFAMFLISHSKAAQGDEHLEDHDGTRGYWLRTTSVEAFIALEPWFRVLSVRRPGQVSLLADSSFSEQGIRLAYMEPDQVPSSFDAGNQPARSLKRTTNSARLQLAATGGLRYTVQVRLEADHARLRLDYQLENIGEITRRIACWSVLSFGAQGNIVVPFAKKSRSRRRLVLPWWAAWPQPGAHFGRDALAVDISKEALGDAYKIGVITDCGWIAFIRGGEVIVSSARFARDASYPEDGANVSLFKSGAANNGRSETEQMSRLQEVSRGRAALFSETLDLFPIEFPLPAGADEVRHLVEMRLQINPPPAGLQP